ncbi:MAG: hypothetical protein NTU57_03245 [Candidatus Aenigmarchaeota archaeon]|nr:hypothetical protein [Candidatus Aenigmarchaeota archaeon]
MKLQVTFPFENDIPREYRGHTMWVEQKGMPEGYDTGLLHAGYYIAEIINPESPHNTIPVTTVSEIAHKLTYARVNKFYKNIGAGAFLMLTNDAMVKTAEKAFPRNEQVA